MTSSLSIDWLRHTIYNQQSLHTQLRALQSSTRIKLSTQLDQRKHGKFGDADASRLVGRFRQRRPSHSISAVADIQLDQQKHICRNINNAENGWVFYINYGDDDFRTDFHKLAFSYSWISVTNIL